MAVHDLSTCFSLNPWAELEFPAWLQCPTSAPTLGASGWRRCEDKPPQPTAVQPSPGVKHFADHRRCFLIWFLNINVKMFALLSPRPFCEIHTLLYKQLHHNPYLWFPTLVWSQMNLPLGRSSFPRGSPLLVGMRGHQPTWRNQLTHKPKATPAICVTLSPCQRVKHFISLQQALGYFQPLCGLLSLLGMSIVCVVHCSFLQGSRSLSAAGCLISPPPRGWKKPPSTTPSSLLCHSLIFFLIWYLLWLLNLTRIVLLWSTTLHALLVAVLLKFDGSRFHSGRKGEGWYQLSISVSCSRSSLSAVLCFAECEKFHFFSSLLTHLVQHAPALGC